MVVGREKVFFEEEEMNHHGKIQLVIPAGSKVNPRTGEEAEEAQIPCKMTPIHHSWPAPISFLSSYD